MDERIGPSGPVQKPRTEEQVRQQLLRLAGKLADQAESMLAESSADGMAFAETAAVLFDVARAKQTDVPPDGGRTVQPAPTDVPPDGG